MAVEETVDHPRRHVRLSGVYNVRDLGGYATLDGRRVRWGRVYRGGAPYAATADDIAALVARDLRVICDFRSGPERLAGQNTWAPRHGIELWGLADEAVVGDSRHVLDAALSSVEQTRALMTRTYEQIPFDQAPSYAAAFGRIAQGRLPLLFHCSAGKDRSGVAAALLLTALGVRRDDVMRDYLLSREARQRIEEAFIADPRHEKALENRARAWEPLMDSDPNYLSAMFGAVEARRGSIEAYFEHDLGIDAAGLQALRNELLE
jgi:protein-tyrosine phosphatase